MGRSIALTLAEEGTKVAITGRNQIMLNKVVTEITGSSGTAKSFVLDVTNENQAESVTDEILKEWGNIDILVNNSGIAVRALPEDLAAGQWYYSSTEGMVTRKKG